LLSLQVITVNRRHCPIRASRYGRADARALGANRRSPAPDVPSAARSQRHACAHRPSLWGRTAATTRGATAGGMISALFRPRTALPAQPGEITTANGATNPSRPSAHAARVTRRTRAAREPTGPHADSGQVSRAEKNEHSAWSGDPAAPERLATARPCQQPSPVAEPYPNGCTGPHTAAVAVLWCCTRPLSYGAQDFELCT
jgi:hypothetical protein